MHFGTRTSIHNLLPSATVTVANIGHRPTTLHKVGFHSHTARMQVFDTEEDANAGRVRSETSGDLGCVIADSVFLEPGEVREFDATSAVLGLGVWADKPLRLYAIDIRGRRVWGDAAPVFRLMFREHPRPDLLPDDLREHLKATPPAEHLLPATVVPRWHVWRRRELRNPKAWRAPPD